MVDAVEMGPCSVLSALIMVRKVLKPRRVVIFGTGAPSMGARLLPLAVTEQLAWQQWLNVQIAIGTTSR